MKFKISQQTDIIDHLMEHLENGIMGIAIAKDWTYERIKNTVYFELKPGAEIKLDVLFWFGYFTKD